MAGRLLPLALCLLALVACAAAKAAVKPLPQTNVKKAPARKDLSKRMEKLNTLDMMIAVRALFGVWCRYICYVRRVRGGSEKC